MTSPASVRIRLVFFGVPAELNFEPPDAIKLVLGVSREKLLDGGYIPVGHRVRLVVVGAGRDTQDMEEPPTPSRVDLVQDGYFFGRFISAVALPSIR